MPFICIILLRFILKVWCKYRDKDFKEYSDSLDDIIEKTKLSFKVLLIIVIPLLSIVLVNIFNFKHLIHCFVKLECNLLDIIISIIIASLLFIIQMVYLKKTINFSNYISICQKYNIVTSYYAYYLHQIIAVSYY